VGRQTALRRQRLVGEFANYVFEQTAGTSWEQLVREDGPRLSALMREYGYGLYDANRPVGDLRDTLLGVTDAQGYARAAMSETWRVVKTWEKLEPSEVRTPVPFNVLLAMRATALAWGWQTIAVLLHVAFFCLLRPAELFGLRRSDILLVETEAGTEWLVRLARTKSWSRSSRSQYAKLDAKNACDGCNLYVKSMARTALLWPASPAAFAGRLRASARAVTGMPSPYTVGSLRTGGATHLFRLWDEDLPRLCWRGRWRDVNTVWHYVQELAATEIMQFFGEEAQRRIEGLAALLPALVADWVLQESC
jgi:hypothetical protein